MMTVRLADLKDTRAIAKVLQATLNMPTHDEAKAAFENEFAQGHQFLVAVENNQIVGLISVIFHGRPRHGLVELDHISVLPKYQRQGIATRLFQESIKHLDRFYQQKGFKLRKYFLLTHAGNLKAHQFYQKIGFTQEATFINHFYQDIDEYVFSKFFDQ